MQYKIQIMAQVLVILMMITNVTAFEYEVITYKGTERYCRVDGCFLICEGDEVLADVCTEYSVEADDRDSCEIHPGSCNLICNEKVVTNFCQSSKRSLTEEVINVWPNGEVCYYISPEVNENIAQYAIDQWSVNTDIIFTQCEENSFDNSTAAHNVSVSCTTSETCESSGFISFVRYSGCWSFVGRIPGLSTAGQPISLGDECSTGNAIHEVGHALGLDHEHIRFDRDSYINIFENNIQDQALANFQKRNSTIRENHRPYDIQSIMHYGIFAFSKNGRSTLLPIFGENSTDTVIPGQRTHISDGDIESIKYLYEAEFENRKILLS